VRLPDLEEAISRVWNPEIRPLVDEAYRCYSLGTPRAAIALAWVAVCTDILAKVERLAEAGDGQAEKIAQEIRAAREDVANSGPITRIQTLERDALKTAFDLELIDATEQQLLERLKQDRNLSVHPTLRPLNTPYRPSLEYARAHLRTALDVLLTHAPSQGRRVVGQFATHVADSSFTASTEHIQAIYFDAVRSAARRAIIQLAAKHSLLELDGDGIINPQVLADRMSQCLFAFTERDPPAVVEAFRTSMPRFQEEKGEKQLSALARLGWLGPFWDAVPDAMHDRLNDLVNAIEIAQFDELSPFEIKLLSLVGNSRARGRLSALQAKFDSLSALQKAAVIASRPHEYYSPYSASLLSSAGSYRGAERIARSAILNPTAFADIDELTEILLAWADNPQSRQASAMPQTAVELYRISQQAPFDHREAWEAFLAKIDELEHPESGYRYNEVRAAFETEYGGATPHGAG